MTSAGPLDGLLVADFSRVLAGPYATMLLADLGATVVKVERPGVGDDTRAWGPPYCDGTSTYFQSVNRGKRSVVLDLTTTEGLAAAHRLVAQADVVIENFRPGVMARLGVGAREVHQLNPRAVYCAINGFGTRAGVDLPGYDLLVQAVGGLMSITGPDPATPTKVGVALVDVITGLHALIGILAALRHRDRTGVGQAVEVSLLTSLLSALTNQASAYLNVGVVPTTMGNRHPSIAPYETLQAADRPLVVAVGTDLQFAALCLEVGLIALPHDARFASNAGRVRHREELATELEAGLSTRPASEWVERLVKRGVPAGLVNSLDEAMALAEDLGLSPVVDLGAGPTSSASRQVRCPIDFSRTPPSYPSGPPLLGAGDWPKPR